MVLAAALLVHLGAGEGAAAPACGDPNGVGGISATDALVTLKKSVGQGIACAACACDVTADSKITAVDALSVLKRAVGTTPYLSCFAAPECVLDPTHLLDLLDTNVTAGQLVEVSAEGLDPAQPTWLRFFGGGLSFAVPAVVVESGRAAAAAPPLADNVVAPAGGFRVQVLQGLGPEFAATDVLAGLTIEAPPAPSTPPGTVTADFLLGFVVRADELLAELEPGSDMALAVAQTRNVLQELRDGVTALRDLDLDAFPLGTWKGEAVNLTRDDLVAVDAMVLASLLAQAAIADDPEPLSLPDAWSAGLAAGDLGETRPPAQVASSAALSSVALSSVAPNSVTRSSAALSSGALNYGQQEAAAYQDALVQWEGETATTPARQAYTTAPRAATGFGIGFSVVAGCGALAIGVFALVGGAGIGLALASAALLAVTIQAAGGLIALGGALQDSTPGAVELVKEGMSQAESTMQSVVTGFVIPETTGLLLDIGNAIHDFSSAFDAFGAGTTSTTVTTTSSTTTTTAGQGCWCCCGFFDEVFDCREGAQDMSGSQFFCAFYPPQDCGVGNCVF